MWSDFLFAISLSLSLFALDVQSNATTKSTSFIWINSVRKSTTTKSLHSKQQQNDCCCRCCYCCEYCFIIYICVCFFASAMRMWANFFFDNNLIIPTNRAEHFSSFHIRFSFRTAWQIKMKNMIIVSNINFLCLLIISFFFALSLSHSLSLGFIWVLNSSLLDSIKLKNELWQAKHIHSRNMEWKIHYKGQEKKIKLSVDFKKWTRKLLFFFFAYFFPILFIC